MAQEEVEFDFEEQLRLEALERQTKARDADETSYIDADGMQYEWDEDKRAWFPKVDADFMAQYQMNYGTAAPSSDADSTAAQSTPAADSDDWWPDTNAPGYAEWYHTHYGHLHNADGSYKVDGADSNGDTQSTAAQSQDGEKGASASSEDKPNLEEDADGEPGNKKRKRPPPKPPAWFQPEEEHNTVVYVSGLPTDITEKEFEEFMTKCGLVAMDPRLLKLKLKLYKDADGNMKGDGRCCYIKKESIELALQILDGSVIRGSTVSVQLAEFQMKGDFDAKKAQRKLTNKQKKKRKEQQQKLLDWRLNDKSKADEENKGSEAPPTLFM